MPRVPTYDSPQVEQNTLPQVRLDVPTFATPEFRGGDAPQFYDAANRQALGLAQAAGQASSQAGQIADKLIAQANQVRVDDGLNRVKEAALSLTYDKDTGYTNLKGDNALTRPDGQSLAQEYGAKLRQQINDIAGGLGNDAQRQAFMHQAAGIGTTFVGNVQKHVSQEYHTYALSTSEGIQSTAGRDISLNWSDPQATDAAVHRIQAEVWRQAQLTGKSAEWVEAQTRKVTSAAYKLASTQALSEGNVSVAATYLKLHADEMDASDLLSVRGAIIKQMDSQAGLSAATDVMGKSPMQVGDGVRAFNIAVGAESGGQQFGPDGKPLTSSAGAVGIAQVMEATGPEAAKLAGMLWDRDRWLNDATYNKAIGMAYFQKQLRDNGGDLAKTYAAYNAGPGALAAAVKQADRVNELGKTAPAPVKVNWLQFLPKETQDYVTKNMKAYAAGEGQPKRATLMDLEQQLANDPRVAGSPERMKIARTELDRLYSTQDKAIKQQQEETLDTAYRTLYANGGSMQSLPADVLTNMPGDKLGAIMTFAEKVAAGPKMQNSAAAWAEIMSLPKEQLAAMSPAEFYGKFRPMLDDAHLEKGYALLKDAQGNPDEKHMEIVTTAQRVKAAAEQVNIIPANGSKPSGDQAKALWKFQNTIDERVRQFERIDLQGKRKANSEELGKIIDNTLLDTVNVRRSLWWDKTNQPVATLNPDQLKSAYVTVGGQSIALASIPVGQRAQITLALQRARRPVTESAIAELWVAGGKQKD